MKTSSYLGTQRIVRNLLLSLTMVTLASLCQAGNAGKPAASAASAASAAAAGAADDAGAHVAKAMRQWIFGATEARSEMLPNDRSHHDGAREYDLENYRVAGSKRAYLKYRSSGELGGINLRFTDDASTKTGQGGANWFFVRKSTSKAPIVYGETLAMGYQHGDKADPYIHYGHRRVGINLNWSREPKYEWVILGGQPGTTVHTRDKVAIFNTAHQNFFIYFSREDLPGSHPGDIGWPDSTNLKQSIVSRGLRYVGDRPECLAVKHFGLDCRR